VVVIGAGFAGLTAAWRLSQLGFTVTVFEASDRLGGRVRSISGHGLGMIEGGGELIGANHPSWLHFANRFDLGLSLVTTDGALDQFRLHSPLILHGKPVPPGKQERLYNELYGLFARLNRHAARLNPRKPWLHPRARDWDSISVAQWLNRQKGFGRLCREAFRTQLENDQNVSLKKQSYLGLLAAVKGGAMRNLRTNPGEPSEYWTETEVFRCEGGNESLAEALAQRIVANRGHIHTNAPVKSIAQKRDSAKITWQDPESGEKKSRKADWVVLAIPPSAWRKGLVPKKVAKNGKHILMGRAVKYLARVKDRFWLQSSLAPSATSDRLGDVWEGTDNQNLPLRVGAELSVFAGAAAARRSAAATNPDKYFGRRLETIYAGFRGKFVGGKFMNWPENRWIRAGYSCPGVGQITAVRDFFYKPHGRLVFAGEHTCLAYFGYMEGALESGLHAARQIHRRT